MNFFSLKYQLRSAGSSRREAKELAVLARRITAIELPVLDKDVKAKIAAEIGFGYQAENLVFTRTWEGAVAILFIFFLVFAQTSKPGSALYSVKQGTTKVNTFIKDTVPFVDNSDDGAAHDLQENQKNNKSSLPGTPKSSGRSSTGTGNNDSQSGTSGTSNDPSNLEDGAQSGTSGPTSEQSDGDSHHSGLSDEDSHRGSGSGRDPNKTDGH